MFAAGSSSLNNNLPQHDSVPGCSHWPDRPAAGAETMGDSRASATSGAGEAVHNSDSEESDVDESDPDDDPGDRGEGHELPDIDDVRDKSDEEYDLPLRQRRDRLVKDLSSAMDPTNYNR